MSLVKLSYVTYLSWYWCTLLVWTGGWVAGWVALEEWKLRLTSAKVEVEVEVEAELGNYLRIQLMD